MNKFDNMIQVLTYFSNQCDMFKPMLDGVNEFNNKNRLLNEKIKQTNILYDRMQLNATYLADNANFGVAMIQSPNGEIIASNINIDPKNISIEDRYNLIKKVIIVGKDNYDKDKMEQLLDFYSMLNILTFERYSELLDIIDEQHKEIIIKDTPTTLPEIDNEEKIKEDEKDTTTNVVENKDVINTDSTAKAEDTVDIKNK